MLKKISTFMIMSVVVFIAGTGLNCVSPVSGIETGNPNVKICSRIVMELFENDSAWSPSSFLVYGQAQLNPGIFTEQQVAVPKLSKNAASEPTQIIDSGSYYIAIKTDTIINSTTVFIKDTIVKQLEKSDTIVRNTVSLSDSVISNVISRHLVNDSIFVLDTIVVYDTLFIQHTDTIQKQNDNNKLTGNVYYTTSDKKDGETIGITDSSGIFLKTRPSINLSFLALTLYPSRSSSDLMGIVRNSHINNTTIIEEYIDADGDGLLQKSTSSTARLQLSASYVSPDDSLSLWTLFDAGQDNSFDNVNDNRIHTLRRVYNNSLKHEDIYYGKEESYSSHDTMIVVWNRSFNTDTIASITTRYACLPGNDMLDHHQNRLARLTHSICFRNSTVNQIQVTLTPDTPLTVSTSPLQAAFQAIIDNGKARMGVLEGTIDYSAKSVSGKYSENGVEYEFMYNATSDTIEKFSSF